MREMSMNGQEERTVRANDTAARVIAYLSPYLFWATVGAIVGGILLLGYPAPRGFELAVNRRRRNYRAGREADVPAVTQFSLRPLLQHD